MPVSQTQGCTPVMRDAAARAAAGRYCWFLLVPTIAVLALDQPEKATPASGPAGWGLPDVSRRSPVPALWGILTAPIDERKQVGGNLTAGKNQGNTKKILEAIPRRDATPFHALIGASRREVFEFLRTPARPLNDGTLDAVAFPYPESDRQLRLRKITGTALHHARLAASAGVDSHHRADGVAVRFCSHQAEADAAVAGQLVIPVKKRRTVVRGHQQVQVAIAVKISAGKTTPHFRPAKRSSQLCRHIMKAPLAVVQKQLRRLRVAHIAANIAHGLVNVPVGDNQVQGAVEVHVREQATEAQRVSGRNPYPRLQGNVVIGMLPAQPE